MHARDQLCNRTPIAHPSHYWPHDLPHDPHTAHIIVETFESVEQADEVRAFAHNLMKRNRARKREAERSMNLMDVQAFVASLKEAIVEQVNEEERERKVQKINRLMDAMDVRECYVNLRVCKRPRWCCSSV